MEPDDLDGGSPSEATVGELVLHSGLRAKSGVWSSKVGRALRRRSLAASSRTGEYARSKAWKQISDFAKRAWLLLVAMPVVFFVAMFPLAIELSGGLSTGLADGQEAMRYRMWVASGVLITRTISNSILSGSTSNSRRPLPNSTGT